MSLPRVYRFSPLGLRYQYVFSPRISPFLTLHLPDDDLDRDVRPDLPGGWTRPGEVGVIQPQCLADAIPVRLESASGVVVILHIPLRAVGVVRLGSDGAAADGIPRIGVGEGREGDDRSHVAIVACRPDGDDPIPELPVVVRAEFRCREGESDRQYHSSCSLSAIRRTCCQ